MNNLIVYLLYSIPCCEDDDVCSCHWSAKDLVGIYFNRKDALEKAKNCYLGTVEEEEVQ